MPAKIFNFVKIEHTIFSLPLIFAGAYLGANRHIPGRDTLVLILLAAIGARVFGMAMNRILDRKIDALNQRTKSRELPAGKLSLMDAVSIAWAGFMLYLTACFLLGPFILLLSPIPAVILSTYPLLKRFTWTCHYGIGIALGISPLGAFVAAGGNLNFTPEIILLTGFTIFWMSGYDIIYALQDSEFDKKNNIYSIPGRFNGRTAQIIAGVNHLISFICLLTLTLLFLSSKLVWVPLIACGIIYIFSYLPFVPLPIRFFPLSAITGILGAVLVFL